MSTVAQHWSTYMDSTTSSAHSDHNISYHSYAQQDSARSAGQDPSIPRRMSQGYTSATGAGGDSPFAYSPTNSSSYGHTYNNSQLSYPNSHSASSHPHGSYANSSSYGNSANSSSYGNSANSSYGISPTQQNSANPSSGNVDYYSYSSSGQDNSSLQYSSGSINPAYLGGRQAVRGMPIKSEPSDSSMVRDSHAGSQGVLYPARIQYTDNATDKETSWLKRQCHVCGATSPPGWRKSVLKVGKIVCNACGLYEKTHHRPRPTRLSDESRNGVHRRVSATGQSITSGAESPSRASFAQSPSLSRPPSDTRVQYAPAYANSAPSAHTSSNPNSVNNSPVLQRAAHSGSVSVSGQGSLSGQSGHGSQHGGSRSPPN